MAETLPAPGTPPTIAPGVTPAISRVETASKGKYPDADQELLKLQTAVKRLVPFFTSHRNLFMGIGAEGAVSEIEKLLP